MAWQKIVCLKRNIHDTRSRFVKCKWIKTAMKKLVIFKDGDKMCGLVVWPRNIIIHCSYKTTRKVYYTSFSDISWINCCRIVVFCIKIENHAKYKASRASFANTWAKHPKVFSVKSSLWKSYLFLQYFWYWESIIFHSTYLQIQNKISFAVKLIFVARKKKK